MALEGDIPATNTFESLYSPFFKDFDRPREDLPNKIGISLIYRENFDRISGLQAPLQG
jgi:hypothetical protein